ncbi:phosphoenolpyruvate carboxykinase (ATP) [Iris pallida]|uniref:Phosphoenolpyruvate carboxykinase (ATP) n=1 Tax=Iris pallida TaxID=29817 RepID=A0AAX6I966_IRIPA|nr:phosphoenolpyruvate carboxykinase (ATP) [Iris pallida]
MLHPTKYVAMLVEKIQKYGATGWLVNTGWSGGSMVLAITSSCLTLERSSMPFTRQPSGCELCQDGGVYSIIVEEIFDRNAYLFEGDGKCEDIMLGDLINWPKVFNLLEFEYLLLVLLFCIKFVCILEYSFLQFGCYV